MKERLQLRKQLINILALSFSMGIAIDASPALLTFTFTWLQAKLYLLNLWTFSLRVLLNLMATIHHLNCKQRKGESFSQSDPIKGQNTQKCKQNKKKSFLIS